MNILNFLYTVEVCILYYRMPDVLSLAYNIILCKEDILSLANDNVQGEGSQLNKIF